MEAEIAVVGLGAMGSAALWRLAEQGRAVLGFERFQPGHDRGSSHGGSRIIRTAYFEDPRYVPLVGRAFQLWDELEAVSGQTVLLRTGALMIGGREGPLVAGTLASVRQHGLAHEVLDAHDLEARFPQHITRPGEMGVFEQAAGILFPERAVLAMVARAEVLGAEVRSGIRVTALRPTASGIEIEAAGRTYRVRRAILSPGAWLGTFAPHLPLRVERQVVAWFPLRAAEAYQPTHFPVYLHDTPHGMLYGFPTLDGQTVKAARHHGGDPTQPDALDRTVHPGDLEPIAALVHASLRRVNPEPVRSSVCMYTNTPDQHFLLGELAPGLIVLGGFSGHGFKFAPVLGEAVADLVQRGQTDLPLGFMAPSRWS